MNTQFREEMKQRLEEEQQLLQTELSTISSADIGDHVPGERSALFPKYDDMDDRSEADIAPALEVEEYMQNIDATGVLTGRLHAVEYALERMERGTYGTCEACGADIDTERMRANPAAIECMECAQINA